MKDRKNILVSLQLLITVASPLPVVDPGVFIIQGVETCLAGAGYCMLGNDCSADLDFQAALAGQHCDGLKDGFTPTVNFSCCGLNEKGKAASEEPTTEISSFTITDVGHFLHEEIPILEHQESNDIPDDADVSNLIEIVGVITDMTGVLGLVTEPYTGTVPALTTAQPLTSTTSTSTTSNAAFTPLDDTWDVETNSSHASISLDAFLGKIQEASSSSSTPFQKISVTLPTRATKTFRPEIQRTTSIPHNSNHNPSLGDIEMLILDKA
ncbi:hypothetical protein FHG87_000832 [Trinorchestia longiramus]|nr:hypothetical protein FHG87_000832 [Trinorchestia longiramus]